MSEPFDNGRKRKLEDIARAAAEDAHYRKGKLLRARRERPTEAQCERILSALPPDGRHDADLPTGRMWARCSYRAPPLLADPILACTQRV